MRVKVYSEMDVGSYSESEPHVVISITSPDCDHARLPENPARKGVMCLKFHDVEDEEDSVSKWLRRNGISPVLIDDVTALDVAMFIHCHFEKGDGTLIVNCEAGISRSSGLAAAVLKVINGNDDQIMKDERYHPNKLVNALVTRELKKFF